MHDCTEMNEMKDRPGIVWLYESCEPIFNTHYLPKLDPIAGFEGFNMNPVTSVPVESPLDIVVVEAEIHQQPNSAITNNNRKNKNSKRNSNNTTNNNSNNQVTPVVDPLDMITSDSSSGSGEGTADATVVKKKTCWFWANRICKFENKCRDEHPEKCKKMLETGRCADNRCKLIHPKICRGVFFEGYCSRKNCRYVHPTNIVNRYVSRGSHSTNNRNNNNNNLQFHNPNKNQPGWTQRNQNQNPFNNNPWNQTGERNSPPFLEQWPTPWESRKPMQLLIGNIVEEITSFMRR